MFPFVFAEVQEPKLPYEVPSAELASAYSYLTIAFPPVVVGAVYAITNLVLYPTAVNAVGVPGTVEGIALSTPLVRPLPAAEIARIAIEYDVPFVKSVVPSDDKSVITSSKVEVPVVDLAVHVAPPSVVY